MMPFKDLFKNWQSVAIILLVFFHLVSNAFWEYIDISPPQFDPGNHNNIAIDMKDCFLDLGNTTIPECFRKTPFYPPFLHLTVGAFMAVFGNSIDIAQYINTLFYGLLIIAVYLWSYEVFKNRTVAFLTAFFTSLMPELYNLSRWLWQEIPVVAFIFLSWWALLKSLFYKNTKWTLLSFLFLGLGMLTKWTLAVYLFIPFLVSLVITFKKTASKKIVIRNIVYGFIIVLAIMLPWLLSNFSDFIAISKFWSNPEPNEPLSIFSIENFTFYLKSYIKHTFSFIYFVLFILSLIFSHKSINKRTKVSFFGMIAFTYLYYSALGNKDSRYMLPLIPVFHIIIFNWIVMLFKKEVLDFKIGRREFFKLNKPKPLILGLLLTIVLYQTIQYFAFSYKIPDKNIRLNINFPIIGYTDIINISKRYYPSIPYDDRIVWPVGDIIEDVYEDSKEKPVLLTNIEYPKLNNTNLSLYSKVKKYEIIINDDFPMSQLDGFKTDEDALNYIRTKDYFLVSSNENSSGHYYFKYLENQLQKAFFNGSISRNGMNLIKSYKIAENEVNLFIKDSIGKTTELIRHNECKEESKQCDMVYLYKIVPQKQYNIDTDAVLASVVNNVPETCSTGKCMFSINIPSNSWARVHGSGLEYNGETWDYRSTNGEGLVWIFINNTSENVTTSLNGWGKGNGYKIYTYYLGQSVQISDIEATLKTSLVELKTPGSCNEFGCETVGYSVWDCNSTYCLNVYKFDPVEGREPLFIKGHAEIFGGL